MAETNTPETAQRHRRATIADVAAAAGVSRSAVSKVFNGNGHISKATTERIRAAAAELGWSPSSSAVALRSARTNAIGLVVYRSRDVIAIPPMSSAVIAGIEAVLSPLDLGLLLYLRDRNQEDELAFYRRLTSSRRVDGMILTDSVVDDRRFEMLEQARMPTVLLGTPAAPIPFRHVDVDPPGAGMDAAVAHLIRHGHIHIAYVGGDETRVAAHIRRQAFDESVAQHDGIVGTVTVTSYSPDEAAQETLRLLRSPDRPTAVVYASDPMAMAGMRAAKLDGFRIPEDVSIVGFDGLPMGEWVEPQLSTVKRDGVMRGRAVAWEILDVLGMAPGERPELHAPELVIRGSTARAPK